ncbi:MAG: PIG-L family deacetylase [Patescibacteria group bacterium]
MKQNIFLAVGAHMDDAEIGAGGVLIQAAKAGHRVVILTVVSDYSTWEPTIGREEQVKKDLVALARRFGFEKRFLDYPYHVIDGGDLDLKKRLAETYLDLKPDVAFIHHAEDHWPDHVACGRACHDAFLFSHGLTSDRTIQRCPLIYAFSVSPQQTHAFEADEFFDVSDVIAEYMELLCHTDSCLSGKSVAEVIQNEFTTRGGNPPLLRLSGHGRLKLAECLLSGSRTGAQFAQGFKTVWGKSADGSCFR